MSFSLLSLSLVHTFLLPAKNLCELDKLGELLPRRFFDKFRKQAKVVVIYEELVGSQVAPRHSARASDCHVDVISIAPNLRRSDEDFNCYRNLVGVVGVIVYDLEFHLLDVV